jgi:hypothetical protein
VTKQVPLVVYKKGARHVIGTATVNDDGSVNVMISDANMASDSGLNMEPCYSIKARTPAIYCHLCSLTVCERVTAIVNICECCSSGHTI